mmetsp:Transcript_76795/g.235024  ORF Transcript_76795/g.235024 Transcript_76795/m.235024 type:complete len:764 (-) Transcript_76795:368-2659(-)
MAEFSFHASNDVQPVRPGTASSGRTSKRSSRVWDGDSSDNELTEEPKPINRPRKGAVCAEEHHKAYYYKMPFWNKFAHWEKYLFNALKQCRTLAKFQETELVRFVQAMEIHKRFAGQFFGERGEAGDGLFIVLEGTIECLGHKDRLVGVSEPGAVVDEAQILFGAPRTHSLRARSQECVCGKLRRNDFVNLCVRLEISKRDRRQYYLRSSKLLEMMEDEQIAQLADIVQVRTYEKGDYIVRQGDEGGQEFFILEHGEAIALKSQGKDEQECFHYYGGELFGEKALIENAPRAASIRAVQKCEVLVLTRAQFERLFGGMADLQAQQYLTDPRKLIADFYANGDSRGPAGTLAKHGLTADPKTYGTSQWFAVYRPCSQAAIAKMLSGGAVGKGLNVKGKSAKKGVLSGYVPFVQISDNKHKAMVERSPAAARVKIYYKTKASRDEARKSLESVASEAHGVDGRIRFLEDYAPEVFGIELAEALMAQAYIMRPDLSPVIGWETGRASEPFLMDMNLHAVREPSEPRVVLFQYDESDPMNPRGLLVAYAEKMVKPVVSDFDTFTIGSKGVRYDNLPLDQAKIVNWALDHTDKVLQTLDDKNWMSRWLEVIRKEEEKGFHPKPGKYGFGDPTSLRFIADVVDQTAPCGAIRHGAECCNFYFPQELDDIFLVVWQDFPDLPWESKTEEELRKFLLDRANDGWAFPLNPVWPVRDQGWSDVLKALQNSDHAKGCLQAWYPQEAGIMERMIGLHKQHPRGFRIIDDINRDR